MTEKRHKILRTIMAGILLVSMFLLAQKGAIYVNSVKAENRKNLCVVIDAGHGGADPGKVGISGQLEKDINLQIAFILQKFLQAEGIRTVMTRENDAGLYDAESSNKKVQDMKRRLKIIEDADPDLIISIHQNSYHEKSVKGAQVFYYESGLDSKHLAQFIQEEMRKLDTENHREAKGNNSYYLLKKTSKPIVIVECGFLSNTEEAEKLTHAIYQEKVAWSIYMGTMQYLNKNQRASLEVVKYL